MGNEFTFSNNSNGCFHFVYCSLTLFCSLYNFLVLVTIFQADEDDEPVDKMMEIRKSCVPTCPKPLANYEACKDRIKGKPGASCEIWYYELHHCVDLCVAPKIFAATKE